MQDDRHTHERQVLADLREHTRMLAEELPAPLLRIRVCSGDALIEVEWQQPATAPPADPPVSGGVALVAPSTNGIGPVPSADAGSPAPAPDGTDSHVVTSPMVGTFYSGPEPGADAFVSVGDTITSGQVVGIIEAMKLMNPIVSDISGVVTELHVENAEAVEFGQPLISLATVTAAHTGNAR
jgi:acetyl-CoA carboxylase biotin carboxyl carrier protein